MRKSTCLGVLAGLLTILVPAISNAQSASTRVDVGPGHAAANGAANGHWKRVHTESKVGPIGSLGRALAIGAGPNGLSISHSIGLNGPGQGIGHNFNLSIGPSGAHVSRGAVNAAGGPTRVIAGGNTGFQRFGPPIGGSTVTGFGHRTTAVSESRVTPPLPPRMPPFGGRMMRGPFRF